MNASVYPTERQHTAAGMVGQQGVAAPAAATGIAVFYVYVSYCIMRTVLLGQHASKLTL
jgi:hypothetical protein